MGNNKNQLQHLKTTGKALSQAFETPADPTFVRQVLNNLPDNKPRLVWPWMLAASMATAALVLVTLPPQASEFTARGAHDPKAVQRYLGVEVFVHRGHQNAPRATLAPGESLQDGDGLSFGVFNRGKSTAYLTLFLTSPDGTVVWVTPKTDTQDALLVPAQTTLPLPEGITPDPYDHGQLTLVAVFTSTAMSAREVASRWRTGAQALAPFALSVQTQSFQRIQ